MVQTYNKAFIKNINCPRKFKSLTLGFASENVTMWKQFEKICYDSKMFLVLISSFDTAPPIKCLA